MSKQNKMSVGLGHTTVGRACLVCVLGSSAIEAISMSQKPSLVINVHSLAVEIFCSGNKDLMLT